MGFAVCHGKMTEFFCSVSVVCYCLLYMGDYSTSQQARLVSVKAERPNQQSCSHARQEGGVSQPGGGSASQPAWVGGGSSTPTTMTRT